MDLLLNFYTIIIIRNHQNLFFFVIGKTMIQYGGGEPKGGEVLFVKVYNLVFRKNYLLTKLFNNI